jgi:hypothetical protein
MVAATLVSTRGCVVLTAPCPLPLVTPHDLLSPAAPASPRCCTWYQPAWASPWAVPCCARAASRPCSSRWRNAAAVRACDTSASSQHLLLICGRALCFPTPPSPRLPRLISRLCRYDEEPPKVEAVPAPAEPSVDAPVPAAEPNVTLLPPPTNATLVPSPLAAVVPPPSGAPVVLEGECVHVLCLGCVPAPRQSRLPTLPAPASHGALRSLVVLPNYHRYPTPVPRGPVGRERRPRDCITSGGVCRSQRW